MPEVPCSRALVFKGFHPLRIRRFSEHYRRRAYSNRLYFVSRPAVNDIRVMPELLKSGSTMRRHVVLEKRGEAAKSGGR